MCAIIGVVTNNDNASLVLYNALTVLQHRGQDAAGMATSGNNSNLNIVYSLYLLLFSLLGLEVKQL